MVLVTSLIYDGLAVQANVMFCELTVGSEKRARALLTGLVSGRSARDK
jgi:hypothetical protein